MASRRPIYRKPEKRSTSKIGLLFCLLLAGGVMMVPIGGDLVHRGKMKIRDLALSSGILDLNDCVVTAEHTISCSSNAVGMPLQAAVRRMQDSEAQAASEKEQRLRAEGAVHQLAVELERLNARAAQNQAAQSQFADRNDRFFPAVGDVTPTARTGADNPAATGATQSQPTAAPEPPPPPAPQVEGEPITVMPPADE